MDRPSNWGKSVTLFSFLPTSKFRNENLRTVFHSSPVVNFQRLEQFLSVSNTKRTEMMVFRSNNSSFFEASTSVCVVMNMSPNSPVGYA